MSRHKAPSPKKTPAPKRNVGGRGKQRTDDDPKKKRSK